uniref:Uncharacterized protein n=1 Tax=Arundo donax TaxID=35708 RepID=A0A0A8ZQV5_ARUDO
MSEITDHYCQTFAVLYRTYACACLC